MEPAEVSHAPNTRASPGLGNQAALRSRGLLPTSRAIIDNRMVVGDAHAPSEQRANEVADAASRGDAVPTVGVNLAPPPSELALGAGRPLDSSLRGSLAPTFGDSLSNVRIHDDRAAGRAANQLGANAFTLGGHIVFGHGHYQPQTSQGHRLLTHELAHATAGEAPHIARCDGPRDFEYEIERLSTSEIDAELQSVRTRLLQLEASGESTPEYARLDRQQAALERALGARDRTRLGHARTVQALRVADPFQLAVPADQLFVMSIVNGYRSEVPVGTLLDGSERVLRSPGQYTLGYLRGLPDGLWAGLVGMVEGLGMLAGLALDLIVDSIPGIELYRYASDPAGYMRREREQQAKMRAIGSAFLNFFREFAADPSIVVQMNADLGFTLGEELARMHATFSSQSAFDQGRDIGNFVGQVVFEVLIEIILAVATEGIGNVIRGVAAIGQGARQGSRFANAIRRILDASPVVRRLINSLARVEEGASAVRRVERATDAVDAERRIAAAADGQIDDAARRLESRAPAPEAPRSTEPPLVSEQPRAPDAPRAPEPQRVSEPPAPEPPRVAEQPRAPEAPQAPEPPRPVQPARPPRRPVPDHARRSGNFTTVDPLINDVVPDPLPAQLADHYRYVTNPRPPPPRSLRRIDADERFAQLSIDRDGRLQYADRTRPRPDIPFDAELARPLDIPESARLAPSQPIPAARNAPPGAPARSVDDAVAARRQAQTEARDLRASGDEASAARRETVVRQESEALGDAAARSYMQPQNGLPAYEGTGPNTLDQVYRSADSQADFVVVEAKGGSATNTSSRLDAQGVRHQQGTEGYLRSIIDGSLATPPTANLPRDLAQNLRNALEDGRLRYLEVSQPIARDGSLLPPVARLYF